MLTIGTEGGHEQVKLVILSRSGEATLEPAITYPEIFL
jgi:hypothetical protein